MTFGRPTEAERLARRAAEKASNLRLLVTCAPVARQGTYARTTVAVPQPKEEVKARPGKRTPTVAERAWMDWITAFGCIACRLDGNGYVAPCVHHILRGGQRIGHLFTLPLCPGHHQDGTGQPGLIARHPHKAQFEARYGSELVLLDLLQAEYRAAKTPVNPPGVVTECY